MTQFGAEGSIGARIKAARRARGFDSAAALADAIPGAGLSRSILANIESGRKVDMKVVDLLNIAMALNVPVGYLLAPLTRPEDPLDLPGLSDAFTGMTAAEFDAWLSVVPEGAYRADAAAERNDRNELQALRELEALRRELRRLRIVDALRDEEMTSVPGLLRDARARADDVARQIASIETYLRTAGWQLPQPED
jgi:transcriptional regulator with XRE-family HTH domain